MSKAETADFAETCAECGKPVTIGQGSYYDRAPHEDIGRVYHSGCGDPFGIKAKDAEITKLREELKTARTQEAPLREFTKRMIKDYCWGYGDPDGGEMQDVAEKLGLLVPTIATEEDAADQAEFEPGDTIYKFADWLRSAPPTSISSTEPVETME